MAVTIPELRLPVGQEELEVGWREVADRSSSEPVAEAAEQVRVLPPSRRSTASPTEVAVEGPKEPLGVPILLRINNYVVDLTSERPFSPTPPLRLRPMGALRLAGLAEAAEILGVTKRTALGYSKRRDFPEPLARLASGPVWDAAAVETWCVNHGPFRRGRPTKRET